MSLRSLVLMVMLYGGQLFAFEANFMSDSLKGSLGDVIRFSWQIEHTADENVMVPELNMDGTGIEILKFDVSPIEMGTILSYETAVYDSVGLFAFPSQSIYLENEAGSDSLFLRGPTLEINSILTAADTTFRDIKALHRIRKPINLFYLLLAVAVLGLAYLTYFLIKRIRKPQVQAQTQKIIVPPEEAHVIALRALEKLKRSKYLRFEQFKAFYSDLTYIIREYYENRFLVDALELTTSELLEKIESMAEFDDTLVSETKVLLEKADFIKFAKGTANELESGEALTNTIAIVNRTKVKNNQEITRD